MIWLTARGRPLPVVLRLLYAPVQIDGYDAGAPFAPVPFWAVTLNLAPGPNVTVWPADEPQALFWTM